MKKMYRFLFILACYALLSGHAGAQIVSGNGFLKADYIESGIRANGAFGSSVKCPENYFYNTRPDFGGKLGFISDVGKDGWTVGTPAYIGDYFLPGTPYEGFSIQIDGTLYLNSGAGHSQITGAVTGFSTTDVSQTIEWIGQVNDLQIRQEFSVEKTKGFILVKIYLVNKGTTALNNVYYSREVDPDNEVAQGGAYNTKNVIEQQNPNSSSTALISAQGLLYSSYLGLGSRDCRAKVAVPSSWPNANGSSIWAGTGHRLSAPGNVTGDNAMAIAFRIGTLAAGDSTAFALAYVLNAADLPDAMDRTDPLFNVKTDSYASGSTIDVCAGDEQTIEIVNGDGFSWTWAPSTGLNSTTGSVVKATLSGEMTYTASGSNTCGTTRSITITLNPAITTPPDDADEITGQDSVIAGFNASYSVPAIAGASKYNWTLPAGVTFVSGYNTNNITVNFGPSSTSGDITVAGENGCGAGASTTFEVDMFQLEAPVSAGGSPTSIKQPVITGTAQPGLTVTLYDGATVIGSATAGTDGNYSITPASPLSVGTHTLTVRADDGAGSTSTPSAPLTLSITAKPPTPSAPALVSGTNPLNESKPGITGTAQPNSTVTIYADGVSIGTTTADASGNWTFTPGDDLADGSHELTITAKDAEDNESDASAALTVIIDTGLPEKPDMALASGSSPTKDNQPSLTGTAEAFSIVTIYIDDVESGTANTDEEGKWNYALPSALTDAAYVFTASATDTAGNVSAVRDTLNIVVDTEAPAQPVAGLTAGSSPVNDDQPALSGTAEPFGTVSIYVDGVISGTATADAAGNWTYTIPASLADGSYDIHATTTDAAGNTSVDSETLTVEIDTEAPAKPAVELTNGSSPLNENQPVLNGTAEANSTVTIYVDGVVAGTAATDASGNWSYTPGTALADGSRTITVTAEDAAGNTSETSEELVLVIDTGVPDAPSLPVLSGSSNGHSNNSKPVFTGTAEANSAVDIYVDGILTSTVAADASGNWSYTPSADLSDGTHTISATATDAAGNTSVASGETTVIIDTASPAKPTVTLPGGNAVNNNKPALSGTAEANSTVNIYVDGVIAGTATADASGNWNFTIPAGLTDGTHSISVTATDAAGNTGAASDMLTVEVDTEAPAQPGVGLTTGSSPLNNNKPSLSGTAEANSTVNIYVDGVMTGTATADATGKWNYPLPAALADGTHTITITAEDAVGNSSETSEELVLVIDTGVPDAPSLPVLSGSSNGHSNNSKPVFTGTAEANSAVDIYVDGILTSTVAADASGNWSYTPSADLSDGTHTISATATDAAGNTSVASGATTVIIDTASPAKPTVTLPGGTTVNNNRPAFSGTAEANSIVNIYVDGAIAGTATADASGNWNFTLPAALTDGAYDITVTSTDAAGNTSVASNMLTIAVDTEAPAQPGVALSTGSSPLNENQPSLSGTAEANSTVTIHMNGEVAGTATADASGSWSYTFPTALPEGNQSVTATVTDAAGNTSPVSEVLALVIDTQMPATPSAPVLSGGNNDHSTTNQPTFTGQAEANSTINIYVDGVFAGTATADATGNWSFTLPAALADGQHTIAITATDAAGNTSAAGDAVTIIVDTAIPAAASQPVLANEQNGRTNDNTPALSGTAEPGATITIYNNGEPVGTATADATGNWSFTPATALTDGVNTITTTVTDAAGNTSPESEALSFTVDTHLPVPEITSSATSVTGPFQVNIVFDEAVEGFSAADITLTNGTVSDFTMISATEYRITVTPASENDVTVRLNAGAVPDSAGNGNQASNVLTVRAEFNAVVESVFPNPSRGNIYIRFNGVVPAEGTAIMISVSGQTVLRQQLNFQGNMLMVNASGLAQGVYVLIVNTKNYTYKTRVSIVR